MNKKYGLLSAYTDMLFVSDLHLLLCLQVRQRLSLGYWLRLLVCLCLCLCHQVLFRVVRVRFRYRYPHFVSQWYNGSLPRWHRCFIWLLHGHY